jgi:hypothetical protein
MKQLAAIAICKRSDHHIGALGCLHCLGATVRRYPSLGKPLCFKDCIYCHIQDKTSRCAFLYLTGISTCCREHPGLLPPSLCAFLSIKSPLINGSYDIFFIAYAAFLLESYVVIPLHFFLQALSIDPLNLNLSSKPYIFVILEHQ